MYTILPLRSSPWWTHFYFWHLAVFVAWCDWSCAVTFSACMAHVNSFKQVNEEHFEMNPPADTVSQIVPINSHFPARISKINIEDSREWPGPGVTTRYSGTLAPSRAVSAERDEVSQSEAGAEAEWPIRGLDTHNVLHWVNFHSASCLLSGPRASFISRRIRTDIKNASKHPGQEIN